MIRFFLIFSFCFLNLAQANKNQSKDFKTQKENSQKKSQVSFDDILVQGKYRLSKGSIATIDDRSFLDSLVGIRKNFKDKIKTSRYKK